MFVLLLNFTEESKSFHRNIKSLLRGMSTKKPQIHRMAANERDGFVPPPKPLDLEFTDQDPEIENKVNLLREIRRKKMLTMANRERKHVSVLDRTLQVSLK